MAILTYRFNSLRSFMCCIFLLSGIYTTVAQVYTIQGSGTSGNSPIYSPYTNNYSNSRNQFIITAAELIGIGSPAGGAISAIGFRGASNGGNCSVTFNIQIKHTTQNSFSANNLTTSGGWEPGFTSFYSGTINSNNVNGWKDYSGSFCWDGSSNLMVQVCKQNSCSNPTAPSVYYHQSRATPCGNTGRYGYGSGGTGSNCSWYPSAPLYYGHSVNRPDIRFNLAVTGPCPATAAVITGTANLCQVLPVELERFSAYPSDNKIKLEWITVAETNSDYFSVERSSDGLEFETIHTLKASGNSSSRLNYAAMDEQPLPGINYYRLTQTDVNGVVHQSAIIYVNMDETPQAFIDKLYPNPSNDMIHADLFLPDNGNVQLRLFDYTGKLVMEKAVSTQKGFSTLSTDLSELPKGIYIIKISSGSQVEIYAQRIIKN